MEVLTTAEMERADRLTIAAGTPGFALMLSAGQAVAEAATDLVEEGPVLVVVGPGNNGGDGFVAAAELAAQGREVSVILMCERDAPVAVSLARAVRTVLGRAPEFVVSPGTYDQKHIDRIGRLSNCVAYGPGILDLAHQPDEYVGVDDMTDAATVMALAMADLLGAGA